MSEMKDAVRELRSLEALQSQVSRVKDELNPLSAAADKTANELNQLAAAEKSVTDTAMPLSARLEKVQSELVELRTKAAKSDLTMEDLEATLKQIGTLESTERKLKSIGNAADSATADFKQLDAAIDSVQAEQASTGFGSVAGQIGKMTASLTAAYGAVMGFREAFLFVGDAIKLASDLGETSSQVGVIFGNTADSIRSWAATASTSLGQSTQQAMEAAATFASFGKAAGLSGNSLVGFSKDLVQLATDFASFKNTSVEEAITAIGSALRGESEPIRKFNVFLDEAALKAEAMKLGLYDGTGALDAQTKSLAAYNLIIKQSGDAQGDFARTSDGLAAQTKILSAEFTNLKTALGEGLITPTSTVVSSINDGFIPAMKGAIQYSKDLFAVLSTTPAKGQSVVYDAVAESLNGFNYYMAQAFNNFTPFGYALTALTNKGKEVAQTQTEANAAINKTSEGASTAAAELTKTGLAAATAAGEFQGAGEKADTAGQSMAESFSLGADFKPQIEGIAGGWSDVGDKIAGTKPLLEGNFSLADSIAGKTDEQAQSIGGVNEQLDTTNKLNELIEGKVTETDKKLADQKAKQAASNEEKQKALALDLQIAEALAGGNEEQAKALQYQKDFNGYLKQAIDAGMGEPEANKFAAAMAKAAGSAKGIKDDLSESAKLFKSIEDARAKDAVDKGGKNTKAAQDAIARGDFAGAERAAGRIARKEQSIAQKAADKQAAAEFAALPFSERVASKGQSFRDRMAKLGEGKVGEAGALAKTSPSVDKPGEAGKTASEASGSDKKSGGDLEGLVEGIKTLLEKIEPRLPVAALTA
jgi:HAMP domain-containing protein